MRRTTVHKVKVIPLSTKMRQKVKQYGEIWITNGKQEDGRFSISTTIPVHKGGHPYSVWIVDGKDCKLERI